MLFRSFNEDAAAFSPDGRWIAYSSNESGQFQVDVQPFPPTGGKYQVSKNGGTQPMWRGDGKELFFLAPDLSLMAVDIASGPAFRAGSARRLSQTQAVAPSGLTGQMAYDVTSDGQRFLVKVPASFSPITVVVNWTALLQKRH